MKGTVTVTLKDSVLDPQGEAILHALSKLGFKNIRNVRVGKYFEITLDEKDKGNAEQILKKASSDLLSNVIIEKYNISLEG